MGIEGISRHNGHANVNIKIGLDVVQSRCGDDGSKELFEVSIAGEFQRTTI